MTPITTNSAEAIPTNFPMPMKAAVWFDGSPVGLLCKLVARIRHLSI